ncbi:hypothetical protein HYW55_00890 [Candidatus Gottesmanbacteria bacterium]|nr:hypothetical protein [Candidatus Gottesmanbacteria bacterium]
MFSKKYFIIGILFGLILLGGYLFSLPDGLLHIVFCNVGQGDGAYIRTPENLDMVIDGGPNDSILLCLGKHMPFYDRTIDIVLLTHPQKDHLQGLISLIKRYSVKYFISGLEENDTEGYRMLIEELSRQQIPLKNLFAGDHFELGSVEFTVVWPEKNWVFSHVDLADYPNSLISGAILGLSTETDINDFSYYINLSYGSFHTLFTGDGDIRIQPDILRLGLLQPVTVLKVPHHGSKTGMSREFLDFIRPELAVISVGKNSYGHPSKEAIDLLRNRSIQLRRTDVDGDIEVVSDGKSWQVK